MTPAKLNVLDHPTEAKSCRRCGETKSLTEFYQRKPSRKDKSTYRGWCRWCENKASRDRFHVRHGDRYRRYYMNWRLVDAHGITAGQYDLMLEAQGGICPICQKPPDPQRRLVVDHDHVTGQIRGLLCNACNIGIGKIGDTVDAARRALEYLLRSEGGLR